VIGWEWITEWRQCVTNQSLHNLGIIRGRIERRQLKRKTSVCVCVCVCVFTDRDTSRALPELNSKRCHMRQLLYWYCKGMIIYSENSNPAREFLGFRSGVAEKSVFSGYDATPLGNSSPTLRDYVMVSSSRVEMPKKNALFITMYPKYHEIWYCPYVCRQILSVPRGSAGFTSWKVQISLQLYL